MSRTVGFAIAEGDEERLERLVERFGGGNRSAFLREAMRHMEAVERAGRLRDLQAYGAARASEAGVSYGDVESMVRRVLRTRAT